MAKLKVWLVLILLWVIIGSTYITIKIAIDTIPPFLMSGIRYVLSGALLMVVYILILPKTTTMGLIEVKMFRSAVGTNLYQYLTRDNGRKQQLLGVH
jgi:hypothetical protein